MSYTVHVVIDTGTGELHCVDECGNYTSNMSRMWTDALGRSLGDFNGAPCIEAAPMLAAGLAKMRDPANRDRYKAMEPANGWGNMAGAIAYVEGIHSACLRHPRGKLQVCR